VCDNTLACHGVKALRGLDEEARMQPGQQLRAGTGEEGPDPHRRDDKIIRLYAAGLTVRDIQVHLLDLYS